MDNKVLCPWCGAEMHHCGIKRTYDWEGHEVCGKCGATSPKRWAISQDAVRAQSKAAALRRYTPPIKPMTLEEVLTTDAEMFMEANGDYGVWACRCFVYMHGKAVIVHYIDSLDDIHRFADYGRTWRCWERKPTDEERSAAEWKD